jgi:hypothetical protein
LLYVHVGMTGMELTVPCTEQWVLQLGVPAFQSWRHHLLSPCASLFTSLSHSVHICRWEHQELPPRVGRAWWDEAHFPGLSLFTLFPKQSYQVSVRPLPLIFMQVSKMPSVGSQINYVAALRLINGLRSVKVVVSFFCLCSTRQLKWAQW